MGVSKIIAISALERADTCATNMSTALRNAFDASGQMLNDATVGIGSQRPPYIRGGGNAVNPAFRTAVMRPATELQWQGTDFGTLEQKMSDAVRFTRMCLRLRLMGARMLMRFVDFHRKASG